MLTAAGRRDQPRRRAAAGRDLAHHHDLHIRHRLAVGVQNAAADDGSLLQVAIDAGDGLTCRNAHQLVGRLAGKPHLRSETSLLDADSVRAGLDVIELKASIAIGEGLLWRADPTGSSRRQNDRDLRVGDRRVGAVDGNAAGNVTGLFRGGSLKK